MNGFIAKALSPAGLRTFAVCLLLEAVVLAALYYVTRSLAGAIIVSVVALGPLSLFLALPLYRHFEKSRRATAARTP